MGIDFPLDVVGTLQCITEKIKICRVVSRTQETANVASVVRKEKKNFFHKQQANILFNNQVQNSRKKFLFSRG